MGDDYRQILSTFKSFTISVDGYWDPSETGLGHGAAAPTVQAGTTIDFELYPAGTSGIFYSGSAIVTSISRSGSFDGAVEFSLSADGTGDLAYENA
jgi:predicted secreted protein